PEARSEAVEDGVVVQTADGQAVHLLNATAAFVWERCDGTHPAARIAAELAERTGEPLARVAADVTAALAALREKGLLR
ncbi:MAG: PqqD family protein, partial [Gemmatimonadota bacterium]